MGESTRFRGHTSFRIFSYYDILNLFLEYCSHYAIYSILQTKKVWRGVCKILVMACAKINKT